MTVPRSALAVAVVACACTPKVKWDADKVQEQLTRLEANVPFCTTVDRTASARGAPPPVDGACGGSVTGTSEHEDGVTDYEVVLEAYCTNTAEGELVIDGVLVGREVGTPSDAGPIIDSLEGETDGALVIDHAGEVTEVTMRGGLVEYGVPEAWAPGVPTEDAPDLLSVDRLEITYPDGSTSFFEDILVERTGAGQASLHIVEGRVGVRGDWSAELRTQEDTPVIFDLGTLSLGGEAEYQGRGDTVVRLIPDTLSPGRVDLELNGEPFDSSIDCTEGVVPVLTVGAAVMGQLPIY